MKIEINMRLPLMWTGWNESLKLCDVKKTPHFKFINGNRDEYNQYAGPGKTDRVHSQSKFLELIESTSKNTTEELVDNISFKVEFWPELNKYVLLDGLHRFVILVNRGVKYVNVHTDHWSKVIIESVVNVNEFKV